MNRRLQGFAVVCIGYTLSLLPVAADEPKVKNERETITIQPSEGTFTFPKFADRQSWDIWSNRSGSPLTLTPIDGTIRGHLKIPLDQGLLVSQVSPQSPAWAAGLRDQDILLTLGASPLSNPGDLTKALKEAGEKPIPLTLLRGGEKKTIQVQPLVEIGFGPVASERPVYAIGVMGRPIGPLLRSQLQLGPDRGILINHVDEKGPAAKAGLTVGDILVVLNNEKLLRDEATLSKLIQENGDKPIELSVIHEGNPKTITVTPVQNKDVMVQGRIMATGDSPGMRIDVAMPIGVTMPLSRVDAARDGSGKVVKSTPMAIQFRGQGGNMITTNPMQVTFVAKEDHAGSREASKPDPVAKRLDEMSTQMDSLRKAVEELAKAIKEKK